MKNGPRRQRKTLDELLAVFKSAQLPTALLCILDSADALRVASVWANSGPKWNRPKGTPPKNEAGLWSWLWNGCDWNAEDLAAVSGVHVRNIRKAVRMLIGARVLFPDGTVHTALDRVLRAKIAGKLRKTGALK